MKNTCFGIKYHNMTKYLNKCIQFEFRYTKKFILFA